MWPGDSWSDEYCINIWNSNGYLYLDTLKRTSIDGIVKLMSCHVMYLLDCSEQVAEKHAISLYNIGNEALLLYGVSENLMNNELNSR